MYKKLCVLFAASAMFLMACDTSSLINQFIGHAQEQAQEAFQTAVPSLEVVATSVAPTQAPSGTTGNPFTQAVNKAQTATSYRIQISMLFGTTNNGKYTEEPFIDMTGEVNGKNAHYTSSGGILALLSGDPNNPLEIINADGKTYMKGLKLIPGMDPKVWYIQKDSSTITGFTDMAKPDQYSSFTGNDIDFKKIRNEIVDGQNCDVYFNNLKNLQNAALTALLGSQQDRTDFGSIDKAEMNVWLCGDGFVHEFLLDYEGHNTKNVNEKGALKLNNHMWDFNNPTIVVTAPKDAKPLPGQ